MPRVRIADVAVEAGVSPATVSLVLNGKVARISQGTQDRVREAARSIGYHPNKIAQGLRTRSTKTLGLISDTIATTPFAGRMLAGAQDAARQHGYLLFLVNTNGDLATEREAVQALAGQQVDAMILAAMWHREVEVPEGLSEDTVLLDCFDRSGTHRSVVPDEIGGAITGVSELVRAGHRRIAHLDVDEEDAPIAAAIRHQGYLQVLREAGIAVDPGLHVRGESSSRGGREATDRLLDLPEGRRPTAIFCFNDRMAAGAYAALHRRGMRIPQDMSVVGFDDQQLVASELDPPLTTIALPHYEMGRWATEVALGTGAAAPGAGPHLMPCPIVRRDSVDSPSAAAPTPADGEPCRNPTPRPRSRDRGDVDVAS